MIQRKQTLWLLLSAISSALTFKFPFYSGVVTPGTAGVTGPELTATDNIYLVLLTVVALALSLVTIFLFKDRKRQILFSALGLLSAAGLIVLYWVYSRNFSAGNIAITAILSLLVLLGFYFAIQGIRRDQKLIRDLDRLR